MQTLHADVTLEGELVVVAVEAVASQICAQQYLSRDIFISVSYQLHVMAASGCILMMGTRI